MALVTKEGDRIRLKGLEAEDVVLRAST